MHFVINLRKETLHSINYIVIKSNHFALYWEPTEIVVTGCICFVLCQIGLCMVWLQI